MRVLALPAVVTRSAGRRGRGVVAAAGSWVAALVLLASLAAGACTRQGSGQESDSTTSEPALTADELPVFLAAEPIPKGTEVSEADRMGLITEGVVTRAQYPEDAVVALKTVEGRVAIATIPKGSILRVSMFVEQVEG